MQAPFKTFFYKRNIHKYLAKIENHTAENIVTLSINDWVAIFSRSTAILFFYARIKSSYFSS